MGTDTRFIDTASSGGNGTTEGHSGATAAYASMSSWESSEQTNLTTAGNSHVVHCSGSTADSTVVVIGGWEADASNTLTIKGNRSATDNDGFYSGNDGAISTSHYRVDTGTSVFSTFTIHGEYVTVDGIQVRNAKNNPAAEAFYIRAESGDTGGTSTITRCRIFMDGDGTGILYQDNVNEPSVGHITANLIYAATSNGTGIDIGLSAINANTYNIYNNTVYGYAVGIFTAIGTSGSATINVHNNVVIDCTTEFSGLDDADGTINSTYNAGEGTAPTGHDSNWVQITPGDDFVTYTSYADLSPSDGGALDNAGTTGGPSTDINDATYVTNDIGAWIAEVGAAAGQSIQKRRGGVPYASTVSHSAHQSGVGVF